MGHEEKEEEEEEEGEGEGDGDLGLHEDGDDWLPNGIRGDGIYLKVLES